MNSERALIDSFFGDLLCLSHDGSYWVLRNTQRDRHTSGGSNHNNRPILLLFNFWRRKQQPCKAKHLFHSASSEGLIPERSRVTKNSLARGSVEHDALLTLGSRRAPALVVELDRIPAVAKIFLQPQQCMRTSWHSEGDVGWVYGVSTLHQLLRYQVTPTGDSPGGLEERRGKRKHPPQRKKYVLGLLTTDFVRMTLFHESTDEIV